MIGFRRRSSNFLVVVRWSETLRRNSMAGFCKIVLVVLLDLLVAERHGDLHNWHLASGGNLLLIGASTRSSNPNPNLVGNLDYLLIR